MANLALIPITNIYAGGDYTGRILVGPKQVPMNVLLDTGSSALALDGTKYQPDTADGDQTTNLAQTDSYGDGSNFTGAVITTQISIGDEASPIVLAGANAAIAYTASADMFGLADGILGLAYALLDDAFTMEDDTWQHQYTSTEVRSGSKGTIQPYLTQLAAGGITSDIISFVTRRSFIHVGGGDGEDPLNQGLMVVGGGEQCTTLYTGEFQVAKVLSDDWYSTNLKSVQVGTTDPVLARIEGPQGMSSNSIVDSGTQTLDISPQMLDAILSKFSAEQNQMLTQSIQGQPVAVTDLNLADWPTLTFVLEGLTDDVTLQVTPSDYWQVDTRTVGNAQAAISSGQPGLAILGLPLMNPYFVIFDGEAADGRGVVKFATRAN